MPGVICTDLRLPDLDGRELIIRIRQAWPGAGPTPRIIVLTGDDSESTRAELDELGIHRLLVKPVSVRELRQAACEGDSGGDAAAGAGDPQLMRLFREELEQRLPELDRCISNLDRHSACLILHQLIASSAMNEEHRLTASLRALDEACRQGDTTALLARNYHDFLESAHDCLHRLSTPEA
jgi:CheY-like chemotaxis protein